MDLAVPSNHPDRPGVPRPRMLCEFSRWQDDTLSIPYPSWQGGQQVECDAFHEQLVELKVLGQDWPLGGDSGCALLIYRGDGTCTLAGMFIAGADDHAYAIPAWHLFRPARYWNLPAGARLRPVNP
jgi:hypothetical protein